LGLGLAYLLFERFHRPLPRLEKIAFIASIAAFLLYLLALFFPDGWQYDYSNQEELLNENHDVFMSICRLFAASIVVLLPVAFKYKNPYLVKVVGFGFFLRKKSPESQYIILLIGALSLLLQYSTYLASNGLLGPDRFPLQLCNVAVYLILFALLLKNEKLYHAALVVNVLGALFAVVLVDANYFTASDGTKYLAGVFYCRNVGYILEHTKIIVLPLLCAILKLYKPLKLKDVWDPTIGFAVYHAVALRFGTLFNGLEVITGNAYWDCNYLFMFKASVTTRLVGKFASVFYDVNFQIGPFNFYLGELAIVFIFEALMVGGFYLMYAFFHEKKAGACP
jgi:hypothetical protein